MELSNPSPRCVILYFLLEFLSFLRVLEFFCIKQQFKVEVSVHKGVADFGGLGVVGVLGDLGHVQFLHAS